MQFQDVISLIGLFVAVFAVMVVPFAFYLDNVSKKIQAAQDELIRSISQVQLQNKILAEAAQSVCELSTKTNSRQVFLSGILESVLQKIGSDEVQLHAYRRSIFRFDESILASLNDLLLFSADKRDRLSAFQKAADSLGTLITLRKMKLCRDLHPDLASECSKCIQDLEFRLEHRSKNETLL